MHHCDPDRRVSFQMFELREEIASVEHEVHAFLETDQGRFERWLAARQLRH